MKNYLDLLHRLINSPCKTGRNGKIHSLLNQTLTFDLSQGFPLLTTRKMPFKNGLRELLWFIKSGTSLDTLDVNVHPWWKPFADENGQLGPIYGAQLRRASLHGARSVVKFKPKEMENFKKIDKQIEFLEHDKNSKDEIIGKTLPSNNFGEFKVIQENGRDVSGHKVYKIQFIKTGYVLEAIPKQNLFMGEVSDYLVPLVCGLGYLGANKVGTFFDKNLYQVWVNMLRRCYSTKETLYKNYGAKGVVVHVDWLNFTNFKKEVQLLPRWEERCRNPTAYGLDKDYYGSKIYSKETCVWLTNSENSLYRGDVKPFGIFYEGKLLDTYLSKTQCAKDFKLYTSNICAVLDGKREQYKRYTFSYLPVEEGYVYRHPIAIDQLQNCIDLLKSDPYSRRIGYSLWNSSQLQYMALPPCHGVDVRFNVEDVNGAKHLNMLMTQRSADIILGLSTNISSYAILLSMIAQCVSMVPGKLTISIADVHLYQSHLNAAKFQLQREPMPLPQLRLNPLVTCIDDFKVEDVELINYQSYPPIKAQMVV